MFCQILKRMVLNQRSVKVNFKSTLEKMLNLFENQIYSKNLILETNFKGESDISGNPVQIGQLLFNLFDNAVKYSIPEGRLISQSFK